MYKYSYDYQPHQIAERNKRARRIAARLGIIGEELADDLPANLCQRRVAEERSLADTALHPFFRAVRRGDPVWFVTVCRPEWTCNAGELTPHHVTEVRNWMSRRARNLSGTGQQRMIGFVDVAWNDRRAVGGDSHWNVHAHALVTVEGGQARRRNIRRAFHCEGDGERVLCPVKIKTPPTDYDVLKVAQYNSRSMLLEHYQGRRSYFDRNGIRQSRDTALPADRLLELASLVNVMGPERFWILSGFRRKHGRIMQHPS